ncbi:MAG: hypothetical protein ACYDCQ_18685 [Dehalococcoidia bacterium]
MPLTITRPAPVILPELAGLLLRAEDLAGWRQLFSEIEDCTNDALAARASESGHRRRQLELWGRIDGIAARFIPAAPAAATPPASQPIVIDCSASRFQRGAGALQALTDDAALRDVAASARLFPRNIADNTECVHEVFEEAGVQFDLYRVDFRGGNVLGSVGAVWRRPHGSPLDVLRLAERQAERIRAALRRAEADAPSLLQRK